MYSYTPRQGDFIFAVFDPQVGHEQSGRRPALVISNSAFNQRTGMAIVCPITNTNKDYPFHLRVPTDSASVTGWVMVDQVKSIDYTFRKAKFVAAAPQALLPEVQKLLRVILQDDV